MDEKFVDAMLSTIVLFHKAHKTFRAENPDLSEEEVLAMTDIWWKGLMYSVAANARNDDGTEGIDGFNN